MLESKKIKNIEPRLKLQYSYKKSVQAISREQKRKNRNFEIFVGLIYKWLH